MKFQKYNKKIFIVHIFRKIRFFFYLTFVWDFCIGWNLELKTYYMFFFSSFFASRRKDMEINGLNSKLEDEQNLVAQLQKKIKELQVIMFTLFTSCTFFTRLFCERCKNHTLLFFFLFWKLLRITKQKKDKNYVVRVKAKTRNHFRISEEFKTTTTFEKNKNELHESKFVILVYIYLLLLNTSSYFLN